jgi:hypothetical protein
VSEPAEPEGGDAKPEAKSKSEAEDQAEQQRKAA